MFIRWRFMLQSGLDCFAWLTALTVATWLRFEFSLGKVRLLDLLVVAGIAGLLQVGLGSLAGLYVHRWRFGVLEEVAALCRTYVAVTVLVTLLNWLVLGHHIPASVPVIAGLFGLLFSGSGRFLWRIVQDRTRRPDAADAEPVIVFGAGEGGTQVLSAMLGTKASPYFPVALLDDNARIGKLSIKGVRVRGGRDAIARIATETQATTLLIAIPSATGEMLRELEALATQAGLQTAVLPPVAELFGSGIGVADIRPIAEEDLLGRRVLDTDVDSVAGYLTGRRVLVTGAGGSIGSELCRQIDRFGPAQLVMLDRDESGLQSVQLSIEGQGLLDRDELVVADIRDTDRLDEVFEQFHPEVVFHAAALKHLTLLERNPDEGYKTNVVGTQNLLDVAGRFGVDVFVNISTDKAADPSCVLGRTKRLAEQLTAHAATVHEGTYLSVRFGNVLGSRGSVLPLFRTQIEAGGPVTVTHPDVTRYFMTIPEACELVIQAGAVGEAGHVMVLDMGAPVRIDDVARRLIAESERRIEITYTGLRPGEKLCEALFGAGEVAVTSGHPLIWSVTAEPLDPVKAGIRTLTPAIVVDLRKVTSSTETKLATG
jgi:FlaA1/EpsC-like NDP-sugar epimerase